MLHFLQTLFGSQPAAVGSWKATKLTPAQARRHARWLEQRVYLNWLGPYYKAYHLHKGGLGGTRGLQVKPLHEPGRQGVLLLFHDSIGPGNFRHFFEHLGERILDMGYHRGCTDRKVEQQGAHTEIRLKQFFKPNPTDCPKTGHCNQRFGLLTVDLVAVDQQPLFIRVVNNPVLNDCFTPAASFEELLQALLDAPMPDAATEALVAEYHDTF